MAAELILIQVTALKLSHTPSHDDCTYSPTGEVSTTLSVNGNQVPQILGTWGIEFPYSVTLEPGDKVSVQIAPRDAGFYSIGADFVYAGEGRFERGVDDPRQKAAFADPQGIQLIEFGPARGLLAMFQGYLTPIREVTDQVRQIINSYLPEPDIVNQLEQTEEIHIVDFPPVPDPGALPQFTRQVVDPAASIRCFELAGPPGDVPKVIVSSWPRNMAEAMVQTNQRLSMLLMLHPYAASSWYAGDRYPYGVRHLWDAGLKYMGFRGLNSILSKYRGGGVKPPKRVDMAFYNEEMGLPHQVAAAGKRAAVVMPINRGNSIGRFMDAHYTHSILHEVYAWGLRSEEVYVLPDNLGPCALAGFSSGNELMASFLNRNAGTMFCDEIVREVYSMDPPHLTHAADQISSAADAWMARGNPEKRFRLYTQMPAHNTFTKFKAQPSDRLPRAPFVLDRDGRLTLVSTSPESFTAAAKSLDPTFHKFYTGGDGDAHRIINQIMLVDALRRSLLPDA